MKIQISKAQAKRLVTLVLPLYLQTFHELKSARGGELVWPPSIVKQKQNMKASNYVDLYDDDKRLVGAMSLAIFNKVQHKKIKEGIKNKGIDIAQAAFDDLFDEFLAFAHDLIQKIQDDPDSIEEQGEEVSYTPEQISQMQYLFISSLALYHNVFSIMVYGKSLSKLVQEAIGGNDKSFLEAIKVDHSLLPEHHYFKERYAKAVQNQEVNFTQKVLAKQSAPSLTGRIKHQGLYAMFYFLDMLQVLDKFDNGELFQLYTASVVTDDDATPYGLSAFSELIRKYKKGR